MADSALKAAKAGDLAALKEELEDFPSPDLDEVAIYNRTDKIVCAAACSGHAEMLKWLLETRFPAYVSHVYVHMAAIQGGPEVYEVFLQKWPHLIDWELGHHGNPLGVSVFKNDMSMVKFMLGKGVDPNTAQFLHREFRNHPTSCARVDKDIIDMLVEYGFEKPETPGQKSPKETLRCHGCVIF